MVANVFKIRGKTIPIGDLGKIQAMSEIKTSK